MKCELSFKNQRRPCKNINLVTRRIPPRALAIEGNANWTLIYRFCCWITFFKTSHSQFSAFTESDYVFFAILTLDYFYCLRTRTGAGEIASSKIHI